MKVLILIAGIAIWIILFWIVYWGGSKILKLSRKSELKRWGMEISNYEYELSEFRFYVITFFVGIAILVVIAVLQELFGL